MPRLFSTFKAEITQKSMLIVRVRHAQLEDFFAFVTALENAGWSTFSPPVVGSPELLHRCVK